MATTVRNLTDKQLADARLDKITFEDEITDSEIIDELHRRHPALAGWWAAYLYLNRLHKERIEAESGFDLMRLTELDPASKALADRYAELVAQVGQ